MTKQMGRNADFCRGDRPRRDRRVGQCRHGMRPRHAPRRHERSAISATSSRSRGPRRTLRPRSRRTTGPCSTTRRPARRPRPAQKRGRSQPHAGAHPGPQGDRYLSRPRGRLRRRATWSPSPTASTRCEGAAFAGITTFPALLFDEATRKIAPTPNLAHAARRPPRRWPRPAARRSRSTRRARLHPPCSRRWPRPAPLRSSPATA